MQFSIQFQRINTEREGKRKKNSFFFLRAIDASSDML